MYKKKNVYTGEKEQQYNEHRDNGIVVVIYQNKTKKNHSDENNRWSKKVNKRRKWIRKEGIKTEENNNKRIHKKIKKSK